MMNKADTIKKLNENALLIWNSDTFNNVLTAHYNFLFDNKKQVNKNTFEKAITFQDKTQNDKGEYDTFDVIVTEKHNKSGIVYKIVDIITY